ncbi:hypothetical protein [Escherichia phage SUSP2]|uniref:Uncharacterized protein n=1 Tax=Escherichia phage SUSP2 TaxID=1718669 RepID=A0A0N9SLA0_9CAUD|nr:hypothetical protein AVU06_gp099 [Escherichia phage SUSP2]ALH47127.1 hypothetical protein [Escherichia phage SUSP2]
MAINNRDTAILKARLTVNRINVITSAAPDETLHNIIGKIQGAILDVESVKNSLANVASGVTLDGAQYEMIDMLGKSKVMNKELDLKMFRFAVKVWLSVEYDANFAIADFFATWLQRNLTSYDFRGICDAIYAEL